MNSLMKPSSGRMGAWGFSSADQAEGGIAERNVAENNVARIRDLLTTVRLISFDPVDYGMEMVGM